MSNIAGVLRGYTAGTKTMEDVQEALAGTGITFDPYKNAFTIEELTSAVGGDKPTGAGIYDDGVKMCKVHVKDGKMPERVFGLPEGWSTDGYYPGNHYVYIAGEQYIIDTDGETMLPYTGQDFSAPASESTKELDRSRKPEYANRTDVEQKTAYGTFICSYGPDGQYLGARRK